METLLGWRNVAVEVAGVANIRIGVDVEDKIQRMAQARVK